MIGAVPTTLTNLSVLSSFYINSNYLNRTNTHLADMAGALLARYNSRVGGKSRANQGDITAPVLISGSSAI